MDKSKKSVELKSRVTPEFKAEVDQKAKQAEMTTSDYIRLACGDERKIIVLAEGKLIAQKLCEACTLLEKVASNGAIERQNTDKLYALLSDTYGVFNAVYDKLPDILLEDKEEED